MRVEKRKKTTTFFRRLDIVLPAFTDYMQMHFNNIVMGFSLRLVAYCCLLFLFESLASDAVDFTATTTTTDCLPTHGGNDVKRIMQKSSML